MLVAQGLLCQNKNDSLKNKTFQELNDLSIKAIDNSDSIQLYIYKNYHLKKAKSEQNNLEIARAYFSFITWADIENDIKYSDSIISITKNSNHEMYPTNGYLVKAQLYYFNSDFNKALDNYIIAGEWADKKQFKLMQIEVDIGIATIKNVWGLHEEALNIYRKIYSDIINAPNYLETYYDDYLLMVNNLSLSYIRNKKPDSALTILRTAIKETNKNNDSLAHADLVKVHATANFYLKKYPQALDTLVKFSSNYSGLVLADSYFMMGKIYQYKNNERLMINYFKKIDSIHRELNDPFPELKEVYNILYKNAIKNNNKDKQLYYLNQLLAADSILDENYVNINRKVYSEFDIPNLKKEKHQLVQKLDNRQQWLFISIVSVIFLSIVIVYYYKRQQTFKLKFQELLKGDDINIFEVKTQQNHETGLNISKHIVDEVLENLSKFESSKGYLSKDITLASLSKDCNTNSSYLSSIINHIKQTNFSTYLKDLRINNAIISIKKQRMYLKYSIQGLAEEFGFTTAESFSKAFREKTSIKPSYFLNELRKKKQLDK
ncbi:helix-turn-helix domain-containing protein [Mariniflexile ostreae]|uniref:Helix-turn-helix domain-containing protein n=1 Tax=Mariniflexile ostreae TaxID=1520892 RepID=A0ABV5FF03_9FLAO